MSRMFNIAVVGCGAMAQGMHLPNVARHPGIHLRWCCDVDHKTLDHVATTYHPDRTTTNIAEIAADKECDAAIVATHPAGRLEIVRTLAAAGKHIYAEKPIADNFADMLSIQQIVKKTGIVFTVGHNRRMAPALREARDIYRNHRDHPQSEPWRWDRVGARRPRLPQEQQTCMLQRINDDSLSWKEWVFQEKAGALLLELNHFSDLACYFIEREPVLVSATGDAIMNVVVNITFADGSLGVIFDACTGTFGYPKELCEIYQGGAVIAVDHCMEVRTAGIPGQPFRRVYPSATDPAVAGIEAWYDRTIEAMRKPVDPRFPLAAPGPNKGHFELLDAFVRACRNEGENPCDAVAGTRAAAIVLKAEESLRRGGAPRKMEAADYVAETVR